MAWETDESEEFDAWFDTLSLDDQQHVTAALEYLRREGPMAKMPLSRPIRQPNRCAMKELRPASEGRTEFRILYAFDYRRTGLLLLGGDKAGNWTTWYNSNVPVADGIFSRMVKQAKKDEEERARSAGARPPASTDRPRRRRR